MINFQSEIESALKGHKMTASYQQLNKLSTFAGEIITFNKSLNLVSKTDPEREVLKQIADSSILIRFGDLAPKIRLLNPGSGGGFPGLVIKILRPDINLCSLDASPTKILFQEAVAKKLQLKECEFIALPYQEYKVAKGYDLIVVKALGQFKKLLRFASANLKNQGRIAFYLGTKIPAELNDLDKWALNRLATYKYELAGYPGRYQLLILKKK